MSIKQLSTRIELSFWQITISLLSKSNMLQRLVRWFYLDFWPKTEQLTGRFERRRLYRWSAAGLGFGFFVGILASVI